MKKLMMMAAVALAAVSVNAASVTWNTGTVYKPGTENKMSGGKGFMYNVGSEYMAVIEGIVADKGIDAAMQQIYTDYKDATGGTAMQNSATTTSLKGNKFYQGAGKFVTNESDSPNTTVNKIVLFTWTDTANDKDYFIANMISATSDEEGNWNSINNIGTNWGGGSGTSLGGFKEPASIPEPTSAMLMLLGVAGLALRRKRA